MLNKIEKLEVYSTSPDGTCWITHPTTKDFMDKINEIIDYLNKKEEPTNE